jgi:CMP-N,N'-diacetyllegionaminic acid synthase
MLTLAVIPARGHSKGLPGKHLRKIAGIPMISHTIQAALAARRVDRVVVSTDDPAIARVARAAGAEAPYLRPEELARDDTPTFPVIEHAVRAFEADGGHVDVVVTLQPTSPLRTAAQIDEAIALLDPPRVRSAVSVTALDLPASVVGALVGGRFQAIPLPPGTDVRRQGSPAAVRLTGAIYVTARDLLAEGRLIDDAPAALLSDSRSAIDVDDARDLAAARRAAASGS